MRCCGDLNSTVCDVCVFEPSVFGVKRNLGPSFMVSGTRDSPSLEVTLSSFICEKVIPVGRVKVNPALLFINLTE